MLTKIPHFYCSSVFCHIQVFITLHYRLSWENLSLADDNNMYQEAYLSCPRRNVLGIAHHHGLYDLVWLFKSNIGCVLLWLWLFHLLRMVVVDNPDCWSTYICLHSHTLYSWCRKHLSGYTSNIQLHITAFLNCPIQVNWHTGIL